MERRVCHFSGEVQGVGFRYTTQGIARGYAVRGYVRNLSDGRVELVVEGDAGEIGRFVEAIREQMRPFIHDLAERVEPATGEFRGFAIRH